MKKSPKKKGRSQQEKESDEKKIYSINTGAQSGEIHF